LESHVRRTPRLGNRRSFNVRIGISCELSVGCPSGSEVAAAKRRRRLSRSCLGRRAVPGSPTAQNDLVIDNAQSQVFSIRNFVRAFSRGGPTKGWSYVSLILVNVRRLAGRPRNGDHRQEDH
jgi:hypothetical protein